MNRLVLGLCLSLAITGPVLAQTSSPTPIQRRAPLNKTEPPPTVNNVTVAPVPQTDQKDNTYSYCANSMRVFRGIGTYNPEYKQYSVNFQFKLCFTHGNELYVISRIFLVPLDTSEYNHFFWTSIVNQPVKLIIKDYKIFRVGSVDEIIASKFDIVRDD